MSKMDRLLRGDRDALMEYRRKLSKALKREPEDGCDVRDITIRYSYLWDTLDEISRVGETPHTANVILFKPSGKYYTEEKWEIPEGAIGPWDMKKSPDFHRIDGGSVLVPSQEPWGFPQLFPNSDEDWDDA